MAKRSPQRQSDYDAWKDEEDFVFFSRGMHKYILELYGSVRGGMVMVWVNGISRMPDIWPANDAGTMNLEHSIEYDSFDAAREAYISANQYWKVAALCFEDINEDDNIIEDEI